MNEQTVVITGASGFLGSHLVQTLTGLCFKVIPVSRQFGFDVCDSSSLDKLPRFDVLIHLAAQTFVPDSYQHTASFYATNILGTLNCLEVCKKYNAHLIFSSSYVYGPPAYLPVDENHPVNFWNPYATSKIIGEQLCQSYHKEFNLEVDVLRIFNIYGPGQNSTFVIPKIMRGIIGGQLNLETGSPKRDFVFVSDVCAAILSCMNKKVKTDSGFNIFNIGSGTSYSVNEIISMVEMISGKKVPVAFSEEKRKVEVPDVIADYRKIKVSTGWKPAVEIKEGLRMMFDQMIAEK